MEDRVLYAAQYSNCDGDYVEVLGVEIREALLQAYLAGAAWAATKNEGWATPALAEQEFTRWLAVAGSV